ncbi:hypothetical protein V6Z12_A13G154600 [Gossypium hirsutum]
MCFGWKVEVGLEKGKIFYWTRVKSPSIWGKRLTDFNCVRHFPSPLHPGKIYTHCCFVFCLLLFFRISFFLARARRKRRSKRMVC